MGDFDTHVMIWLIFLLAAAAAAAAFVVWRRNQGVHTHGARAAAEHAGVSGAEVADIVAASNAAMPKDISFKVRSEPGASNVWGDVMCADGVYLPDVNEADFQASYDGRWLRTGQYGAISARLIDRKTRQVWQLSTSEAELITNVLWRLPRWDGEDHNESAMTDDSHSIFTDVAFAEWLNMNVQSPPVDMVQIRDLWVPRDCVKRSEDVAEPVLPPSPTGDTTLSVERYWPMSLKNEPNPLEAYNNPEWYLHINGKPQPIILGRGLPIVWKPDGNALALYAYPELNGKRQPKLVLAIWSKTHGWQRWDDTHIPDSKPWRISPYLPAADDAQGAARALRWWGEILLQRAEIDPPRLEHLHAGAYLNSANTDSPLFSDALRLADGRVQARPVPRTALLWQRNMKQPDKIVAMSEPVAGHSLVWTLDQKASQSATVGATSSWRLHWGNDSVPGLWELEHVIVRQRWAVLLRHPNDDAQEDNTQVYVWDGRQLKFLELPWRVMRLRATPGPKGGRGDRVQLLALVSATLTAEPERTPVPWQWVLHQPSTENLEQASYVPVYEVRDMVPDSHGVWMSRPRWREVDRIQHPCADGDYIWRNADNADEIWWCGGLTQARSNEWNPWMPRGDGVIVTSGGAMLCGVGPSAMPHPEGEGWFVLEPPETPSSVQPGHWKLHWLQARKRQVRTLTIEAWMPMLKSWDAKGVQWWDAGQEVVRMPAAPAALPAADAADDASALSSPPTQTALSLAAPTDTSAPEQFQMIEMTEWARSSVQDLKQGAYGLWLRKQDMRYIDAIFHRDDWPWEKKKK